MRWVGTYQEYLQSPYWRRHVRPRIMRRAAGRCEGCGGDYALEVHHLTYDRLGHEHDQDLKALCAGCHSGQHGYDRDPSLKRGFVSVQAIMSRWALHPEDSGGL